MFHIFSVPHYSPRLGKIYGTLILLLLHRWNLAKVEHSIFVIMNDETDHLHAVSTAVGFSRDHPHPYTLSSISGQLPTRTLPHLTCIGPHECLYSVVVVQVGRCPGGNSPRKRAIMVLVGNGWALFLSGGEFSLVGSCPRTFIFNKLQEKLVSRSNLILWSFFIWEENMVWPNFAFVHVYVHVRWKAYAPNAILEPNYKQISILNFKFSTSREFQ